MKHLTKKFSLLLLMSSIATTYSIKTMDRFNNIIITVENENNDPLSLLQLRYQKLESSPYSHNLNLVGINDLMNAPTKIKCHIASDDEYLSLLKISDPRSYYQKDINLKVSPNDILTIHAKNEKNVIIIKKNGEIIGKFKY